jgi:hypothetical protein
MKGARLWVALAGSAFGAVVGARLLSAARRSPLLESDEQFHHAYGLRRTAATREGPVLVLLSDALYLFARGSTLTVSATDPVTHVIKAVAHMPVGLFTTLQARADEDAELDETRARGLSRIRCEPQALLGLDASERRDVEQLVGACQAFAARVLSQRRCSSAELARFAAEQGPTLLRLTEYATRRELDALHAATERALSALDDAGRRSLEVVVAGVHHARARSLGLQYFLKRFGEAPGEERRVTFAEAATDPEQARELIGTRRLDRAIASAFFGDARRLQRDVLGDAAAKQLGRTELDRVP